VHKLGGSRMVRLAREATAVRATGEKGAIHALIAAHHKFGKRLSDLQLSLLSQNRKANKRVAGGAQIEFYVRRFYCWIWRAGLLCLAVGGCVPLAAPPKNGPTTPVSPAWAPSRRRHRLDGRWLLLLRQW
jgi:hypothetical protein